MGQRLDSRIVSYMQRHTVVAGDINWEDLARRIGGGNPELVQDAFRRMTERGDVLPVQLETERVWNLKACSCALLRTELTALEDELKRRTDRTAELNGQIGDLHEACSQFSQKIAALEQEIAEYRKKRRRIPFFSTLRDGWRVLFSGSLQSNA
ncbi:MAG TPA: hypothetical protein VFZ48_05040 [Candidatus Saccharimonadales bacterium]